MQIMFEDHDGIGVAVVTGNADAATAPELTRALIDHIEGGSSRVVADLSGLEYSSSAGLRAILAAVKLARTSGGDFRLAAVREQVRRVLDLTGFSTIIRSYDDVDSAVTSFAA